MTADRSISVFILASMDRAQAPLTSDEISETVVQEYVLERRAIDKRLAEQVVTGTVYQVGDSYVISDEGRRLVDLYELIARVFNIDPTNLAP